MTQRFCEVDGLDEQLGITFGLGIDLDTIDEAFRLYAAFGGLEETAEGSLREASIECHDEPQR